VAYKIKFGTDGWRAIIAQDYTVDNVARVAAATADYLLQVKPINTIVLGFDCRFGGEMFAETVIKVMFGKSIKVIYYDKICTTPMLSLACAEYKADIGIMITASHNPHTYNGFKLKSTFGGPTPPSEIMKVESLIKDDHFIPDIAISQIEADGYITRKDFRTLYLNRVRAGFDLDIIRNSKIKIAYDAMYGAGQSIVPDLLPDAAHFNCEWNPRFNGIAPEPIPGNMQDFAQFIREKGNIDIAFANDGDADRIALMDRHGKYIDAHQIILMLIYILHKDRGMTGKVVVAFSVSPKIKKMCDLYGLPIEITKIGFKYIAEIIQEGGVLVGGEESGGISVAGHIPERDGIWDALVIIDYLARTGKSLEDLIQDIDDIVGAFAYGRNDLKLTEAKKESILDYCNNTKIEVLGGLNVEKTETIDGFKYYLEGERVLMIRASGTEPVLRVYCQAETDNKVDEILEKVVSELLLQ
jgi:phosphomannomutase